MQFVDEALRVEMNTHGGITLHFPSTDRHPEFMIWSTIGGQWAINRNPPYEDNLDPKTNQLWGHDKIYADYYDSLAQAAFSKMYRNKEGMVTRAEKDGK